jgi:hypothetical protein
LRRIPGDTLSELRWFDVIASGPLGTFTYECKRDRMAHKTGNVAIEHKAIKHSRADYIVYCLDEPDGSFGQLLQIPRKTLYDLLVWNWKRNQNGEPCFRVTRGGDYNDLMTLIPVNAFIYRCEPV